MFDLLRVLVDHKLWLTRLTKCYIVCSVNQLSKIYMNIQKTVMTIGVGILLAAALAANAAETPVSASLSILKSVPSAELPGRAAALVAAADAKSQVQTTVDVVKAAIGLNPAAASAIVASIAASTPDMAAVAAATAASQLPKQAEILAQAAAAAAPKQAGKIVEAVSQVVPQAYQAVAQAVAEVVPSAAKEILAGIAAALPNLKDSITTALAAYKGATPAVSQILAQLPRVVVTDSSSAGVSIVANTIGGTVIPVTYFTPGTPVGTLQASDNAPRANSTGVGGRQQAGVDELNPAPVGSSSK